MKRPAGPGLFAWGEWRPGTLRRAVLRGLVLGVGGCLFTVPAALGVIGAFGGALWLAIAVSLGSGLVLAGPPSVVEGALAERVKPARLCWVTTWVCLIAYPLGFFQLALAAQAVSSGLLPFQAAAGPIASLSQQPARELLAATLFPLGVATQSFVLASYARVAHSMRYPRRSRRLFEPVDLPVAAVGLSSALICAGVSALFLDSFPLLHSVGFGLISATLALFLTHMAGVGVIAIAYDVGDGLERLLPRLGPERGDAEPDPERDRDRGLGGGSDQAT